MVELRSEDLEELAQELEEEYGTDESLPLEDEELLRDLQDDSTSTRLEAAHQLGKLSTSSAAIVQALIFAQESDGDSTVRWYAARALRAPAHQKVLRQHPSQKKRTQFLVGQVAAAKRKRKGHLVKD
jgi:hypothetical protein